MPEQIEFEFVRGALSNPIDLDRRSSFLSWRIFFDGPASTSSENALDRVHVSWDHERHPRICFEHVLHGSTAPHFS
jgi:hypothetical protein